jgi:hypothetical protein
MEHDEPRSGNLKVVIDMTDPYEQKVEKLKVLFANLHEKKHLIAEEEKFLIDSLRDVLDPLGWDIVRRPPGARRRPTSAEKTLKKILGRGSKKPRRRK